MPRHCFALDLQDDPALIAEYDRIHQNVWPEIIRQIRETGITVMDIYRTGNRLFMILETTDEFSFEAKAAADAADPRVREWEKLMWNYQQSLPNTAAGEKWVRLTKIFALPAPVEPRPSLGT